MLFFFKKKNMVMIKQCLHANVKVFYCGRIFVSPCSHIPIHEEMPVVVLEQLVVHVVVCCSAKSKLPKERVPWMWVLAVNQR